MFFSSLSKPALFLMAGLALAACKSDAERAEEYFQSGLELLQEGDADRAIVQFRNVFEFEENHLEARMAMGNLFMEQDNPGAAYGQFLRVAEQYPDNFEARRILAELAFEQNNWDEFERHGSVAVQQQPEDERVQAIDLGLQYRTATIEEDGPARDALTTQAEALLETLPENAILNNLLIDSYARSGRFGKTLDRIDVLLAQRPGDRQLYTRRLAVLAQLQDEAGLEAQLRDMVERFPGEEEIQGMMLRFYVSQQRLEDAESFLREIADPAAEDPGLFLSLIQFVGQTKGAEAARAEIQRAIELNPNPNQFRGMLALMDFNAGERDKAISDIEAVLAEADPALDETNGLKVALARMLVNTGNQVGARRQVEEVLAQNPSNVEALKMQASWQLQADEVDQAIANLRVALDTSPEDVQAMSLMYEAYARLGDSDLARSYLAQAAEASGNAPEPTLRYARVLFSEERYLPAEDVLLPALQRSPGNIEMLGLLGQVYLGLEDFARATQVADTLARIDDESARNLANALRAELLNRQGGTNEALAFLEDLANGEDAGLRDKLVLLQARLRVGESEDALRIIQELVAENPDNVGLKQALADTQAATNDLAGAEATLLEIKEIIPQEHRPWLQLVRIALRQGDPEKADALVEEGLEATNRHPNILWAKAGVLERDNDIDGAIAIYEELYARNSGSIVVANNLASLLATYKDDEASLERAWVLGRRLRDADNPALQDTYGWLLHRRGQSEEALPYLESAAQGLGNDPIVQSHLGFVYAALERNDEALEQLQNAVNLAGPADTRERIEAAREEITRLRGLSEN